MTLIKRKNPTVMLPCLMTDEGKRANQVVCYSKHLMQKAIGVHNSFLYMEDLKDQHNLFSIKVYQEDKQGVFLTEFYPEFVAQAVNQSGVLCVDESADQLLNSVIVRYNGCKAKHIFFSKESLIHFLEEKEDIMHFENGLSIKSADTDHYLGNLITFCAKEIYCDKHGRIFIRLGKKYKEYQSNAYFAYDSITDKGCEYTWHAIDESVFKAWRKGFMEGYHEVK